MDNNFNGQQPVYQQPVPQQPVPQQPVPQQPVYQQPVQQPVPQQPVYQQPVQQAAPQQPMYQQPVYQQPIYQPQVKAPRKPMKYNVFELLSVILSSIGTVMAFIGTSLMCSCNASSIFSRTRRDYTTYFESHPIIILAIVGGLIAAAGVVMAVLALKKKSDKLSKMALIGGIIGVAGVIYAFLPTLTICAYNCSLESAYKARF